MRKKENKPVRSRRAFRRSLILALAAVWLLFAALLTYVTAYHLYKDFSQTADSYADNVSLIGNLDAWYARPELDWYYGQQYAHPDRLIHDMQQIYLRQGGGYYMAMRDPELPLADLLIPDAAYLVDTAVLYYDADGSLMFRNGSILTFSCCTFEEMEAYAEKGLAPDHYGWIDLAALPEGEGFLKKLRNFVPEMALPFRCRWQLSRKKQTKK